MSRLLFIGLLLSGFVAYNRTIPTLVSNKTTTKIKPTVVTDCHKWITPYCNDSSGLRLLGIADTINVRSVMETLNEPVTAKYLLKTSRWGDTLAAFQNTYKAIMPVPFDLFLPLETTPDFPFPHPNAVPFKDSIYPFKIVPSKTDQRLAGITTFDLALLSRHVLGIQLITSPYKLIAADVNKDGSIDGADMLFIRRLILHVDTVFRHVPHWIFIPKTYTIPAILPKLDSIPQAYYFNAYSSSLPNPFEFITIKMGDINNSFRDTTSFSNALGLRSNQPNMVLTTENLRIEAGKTYELNLRAANNDKFIALQGTLGLKNKNLGDLEIIESETLTHFGEQNTHKRQNQVAFSWNDVADKVFRKNETVFKIKIKAQFDGKLSDILTMNDDLSESLVYTEGGETRKIELRFTEPAKDFYVYQNEPNPFDDETSLKIEIKSKTEETTPIKYAVFDENGHLLFQHSQQFGNGIYLLQLNANEMGLTKAGIYFLNVETPSGKQTIKLVKI